MKTFFVLFIVGFSFGINTVTLQAADPGQQNRQRTTDRRQQKPQVEQKQESINHAIPQADRSTDRPKKRPPSPAKIERAEISSDLVKVKDDLATNISPEARVRLKQINAQHKEAGGSTLYDITAQEEIRRLARDKYELIAGELLPRQNIIFENAIRKAGYNVIIERDSIKGFQWQAIIEKDDKFFYLEANMNAMTIRRVRKEDARFARNDPPSPMGQVVFIVNSLF